MWLRPLVAKIFPENHCIFVMIVVKIHAYWSRKAHVSWPSEESQVKVTRKVIRCKKVECQVFQSKTNGENLMWLPHLVAKIFRENHCISLINRL